MEVVNLILIVFITDLIYCYYYHYYHYNRGGGRSGHEMGHISSSSCPRLDYYMTFGISSEDIIVVLRPHLTTFFLGRLRPPKRLTSTNCAYFRQLLTTALFESPGGETNVCGRPGSQ